MIKKVEGFKFVCLALFFCINLFACGYTREDARKYLPGKYFYEIPSGELQVLKVNENFTFNQIIYSKNKKDILYENMGRMHVDGEDIELDNWLECYELAEQKLLLKPRITFSTGIFWRKPGRNEPVLIIMFDQDDYIFRKHR